MVELYYFRHAESVLNKVHHLVGGRTCDSPLTELGIMQAKSLGERLRRTNTRFDAVYSSPAMRALQTAEIVGGIVGFSLDQVIVLDELQELDQGDWEGKPRVEVYTPEVLARIKADNYNFTPPNGESQRMVEERMLSVAQSIVHNPSYEGARVGLFTHNVATKCLLRGILDFSPRHTYTMHIEHTAITRLQYDQKGWHVMGINDAAHLEGIR
jgi:broad specificity phosphatase PhoE